MYFSSIMACISPVLWHVFYQYYGIYFTMVLWHVFQQYYGMYFTNIMACILRIMASILPSPYD